MPAIFIVFSMLVRVATLMAITIAVAAVIYYRHRTAQLELQARDLKTHLQQLQQRDTHRTDTFATTVHELRAPLTSIRGALVLLSAGAIGSPARDAGLLDERAANLLRIAASNTGRLVRLIDELLDLERMESSTSQLELLPCSLDTAIAQAIETMSPMAQEAGIEIDLIPSHPTSQPTPLQFAGDAGRMVQVLCNLLSNAIKFSPHGSTVNLKLHAEPDYLVLRMQDQGRGIPGNKLEAIFDRFVCIGPPLSAHKDPSRPGPTTPTCSGLGLAISRSLVAQHGGTLHAERNDSTSPGKPGTTFILRLPRLITTPTSTSEPPAPYPNVTGRDGQNRPDHSQRPV